MAQRIGTSQAALSGWEQPGGTVLKEQPLTKLLELLGVEFLIPQEGNVNQSPTKGEPDRPSFLIADKSATTGRAGGMRKAPKRGLCG